MSCGVFQRSRLATSTRPSITSIIRSPPSPSRIISTPGSARYTSMKCASSRTSPGEKFSSSGHFGISEWMRPAKRIASPMYSSPASCCAGSAIVSGIMPNFLFAPLSDRVREAGEQRGRIAPPQAGVGDALAEFERLAVLEVLAPLDEVRLDHHADDAPLPRGELRADVARAGPLALVL